MNLPEALRIVLGAKAPDTPPIGFYEKLESLERLLVRWSAKLDLTGFPTEEERRRRYFAEPLAAVKWLPREGRAVDIGSGGGSPGLPFAIATPGVQWTLLEPRLRRRLFLEEAVAELALANVRVSPERFQGGSQLAAISCRGVRLDPADLERVIDALSPGGRFLWLGGDERLRKAAAELAAPGKTEVFGPASLLPGSAAKLLVVSRCERRASPEANSAGGTERCFT
ncbi:MAG TPA: RsmG family class I SAM-dependent methyltransferase [Vicinamibacteria bacterium]